MLHEFLTQQREHIVALTRRKVATRTAPRPTDEEREQELRTLHRCVDEAIAQVVAEYARQRDRALSDRATERLGSFAHEVRNLLQSAILAFEVLKTGTVGVGGSTGTILGRNLIALRDLIDRSLTEVRLEAKLHRREHVLLTQLVEEVELAAAIEARARGFQLTVGPVEPGVAIEVDRQLIAAALANLLQNAFKFSRPNGHIVLRTDTATAPGRVLIEVEDECGGLAPGEAKDLFRPFEQRSADRSGLGLGLTIAHDSRRRRLPRLSSLSRIQARGRYRTGSGRSVGDQSVFSR